MKAKNELPGTTARLNNIPIITEKHEFLPRWKNHFATLHKPSTVGQHAVNNIEQRPTQHWMFKCSDLDKVSKVISMFCDGKSPGADGLHQDVIKEGSRRLVEILYTIFKLGDWQECGNYCRIPLRSIQEKVFGRLLLDRLSTIAKDFPPEAQCGFRINRGITDIWSLCDKYKKNALNRICPSTWYLSTSHCEQGSAKEYNKETSVSWPLCEARIYLAYRNEGINQLKRSTVGTICGWERSETGLFSTQKVWIQSRLWAHLFNARHFKSTKKDQKHTGTRAHVCWRHYYCGIQPPRCTGNNHLFFEI